MTVTVSPSTLNTSHNPNPTIAVNKDGETFGQSSLTLSVRAILDRIEGLRAGSPIGATVSNPVWVELPLRSFDASALASDWEIDAYGFPVSDEVGLSSELQACADFPNITGSLTTGSVSGRRLYCTAAYVVLQSASASALPANMPSIQVLDSFGGSVSGAGIVTDTIATLGDYQIPHEVGSTFTAVDITYYSSFRVRCFNAYGTNAAPVTFRALRLKVYGG